MNHLLSIDYNINDGFVQQIIENNIFYVIIRKRGDDMKRQFTLILIFLLVMILSSCSGIHYQNTDYTVNGYDVYKYDHRFSQMECDRISMFGLFVRDGDLDYVTNKDFGECQNTLYVKDGGNYYSLSEGVSNNLFTLDDVINVDWDFNVYETHDLLDYTEVDNFVFINSESTVNFGDFYMGNLETELERILSISESVYQKFIIDYTPDNLTAIGTIDVYFEGNVVASLTVYEEGIFDSSTNAFQESYTSELFGLYQAIMSN